MSPEELAKFYENATPAEINGLVGQQAQPAQEAQEEQEQPQIEAQEVEQEEIQEKPETSQQKNFRELRESYLRAQWERDEMARQLSELKAKPTPQYEEEEPELDISDDHLIEGKDLKKIIKKIEKKVESKVQREMRQQQQLTQQQLIENRLKLELPDLDRVVNSKNLAMLSRDYPELASTIQTNSDLYTQAKAAYTLIKKLGIEQENPNASNAQRIQKNLAKPKPVQSVAPRQSPLVDISAYDGNLTDDMKREIWSEMQKYSR